MPVVWYTDAMEHEFDAIFENGVLRPLAPLKLPERSQVHVTVSDNGTALTREELDRQQASIVRLMEEMRSLPEEEASDDDSSGRDHDRIIYGWGKK